MSDLDPSSCSELTYFYEQFTKEILPTEYTREAGSIAEHWGMTEMILFLRTKKQETNLTLCVPCIILQCVNVTLCE